MMLEAAFTRVVELQAQRAIAKSEEKRMRESGERAKLRLRQRR